MSTKTTKTTKTTKPTKTAKAVTPNTNSKQAAPSVKKPVVKAPVVSKEVAIKRFSIKNGVVAEDSKGSFVSFVDFKAIYSQNQQLVKTGDKLIAACERSANTEIERVLNGLFAVMTVTIEAMNLIDLSNPKREKLVNKLVKIGEKIGFEVEYVTEK